MFPFKFSQKNSDNSDSENSDFLKKEKSLGKTVLIPK